jgi:hypothetical protein
VLPALHARTHESARATPGGALGQDPNESFAAGVGLVDMLVTLKPETAGDNEFVFSTTGRRPVSYWNFRDRGFAPALEKAGLGAKDITIHGLRSAAISLYAARGLTMLETATVMGQADPGVTWKHYARLFDKSDVDYWRPSRAGRTWAFYDAGKLVRAEGRDDAIAAKAEAAVRAREAQSAQKRGARNPRWKGDAAGYSAIHHWRLRNAPKAGRCAECGTAADTEWANVSGEQRRADPSDWRELCRPCRRRFDASRRRLLDTNARKT